MIAIADQKLLKLTTLSFRMKTSILQKKMTMIKFKWQINLSFQLLLALWQYQIQSIKRKLRKERNQGS